MTSALDEMVTKLSLLPEKERDGLVSEAYKSTAKMVWIPNAGAQTDGYYSEADELYFGGESGGGKRIDINEVLPTPGGFVRMGDIGVGDIIFDESGRQTSVTVVSPIEQAKTYRLTFDDGNEITCCADHLWLTYTAKDLGNLLKKDPAWRARRRATRPSRAKGKKSAVFTASISARNAAAAISGPLPSGNVRTTQEIVDTLLVKHGRHNHAVPVAKAIEMPPANLPIDPYTLGAWLGDGNSSGGGFTGIDAFIWEQIATAGFVITHAKADERKTHYIRNLVPLLRDAGLLHNKHVPAQYLRASKEQRFALLQGLMDTDGHAALDGGCEFDNTRKPLADAVYDLVVSLGIKATIKESVAKLNGRAIGPKWRVKFTTAEPVFRLPRKRARQKLETRQTADFRYIVDAIEIDPIPMRCIAVDSPSHLYLVGRSFIPTHNTDLLLGTALTAHRRSLVLRRLNAEVQGLADRVEEILGTRKGYAASPNSIWRLPGGRVIRFGGCQYLDDRAKYQGTPNDGVFFDELPQFLEQQYVFIINWARSTTPGQRVRVIGAGNPPTTSEGMWVIRRWAPWLDPNHPNPALPGELRWFTTYEDQDFEVDGPGPVKVDGKPLYDHTGKPIRPKSRTFIPAGLADNPDLEETGYGATLAALPGPLRKAMFEGDFTVAQTDNEWQVFPTDWVDQAMTRWSEAGRAAPMTALGVDIAQGGCFDDQTELLTDEGWKLFEQVTGAEKVLTLNQGTAEWGSITAVHRYWHDGQMNLLENASLSFCITDNHQLLAKWPGGDWKISRYDSLPQEFVIPRVVEWQGDNPETISFESRYDMPHGGTRLKHWRFSFEHWARFLGWFVSEGCTFREKRKNGRWRINIAQERGEKFTRIEHLLKGMGITYRLQKSRSAVEFSINSIGSHLAEYCGVHAANKRVPGYIRNARPEIMRAFLEEYRLGDGSLNGSGVATYATTSQLLAGDIHEMLAKLGRAGKLVIAQLAGSAFMIGNRKVVRKKNTYNVTERSTLADCWVVKKDVRRIDYHGFVHCVSTPLKTILVRRKGTVMWSGNSDNTVLAPRHGSWFDHVKVYPGKDTPDGPTVAGLIFKTMRNGCEVILDMGGGYGGSTRDHLKQAFSPTLFNGAEAAEGMKDKTGMLKFANRRAAAAWFLRDALDPEHGAFLALPPDQELKADLTSLRWTPGLRVKIESKEDLKKRIGRSPDRGDAVIMAHYARGKTNHQMIGISNLQHRAVVSDRRPSLLRRG